MRSIFIAAGIWLAIGCAVTLPHALWEVPPGIVASCASICQLGGPDQRRRRSVIAQATIGLRDGRWVNLGGREFHCDCSCSAPSGPAWCLKRGSFIEKRRWELDIRTA